jgi:cytosine/adenosine deaminase-related metal-dependent hydrolase
VSAAYGITDRHGPDGARRGLAENERFLRSGGRGMVGVHAAFTCSDETLEGAAGLAADLGVGVHIHVAEGTIDIDAGARLERLATSTWLLVHCVHLDRPLPGTIAHNPRSNMNNAVGYGQPARRPNRVVLGTDGIGADMLEEFRLAYVRLREDDVLAEPAQPWAWLQNGYELFPDAAGDVVVWNHPHVDDPWWMAFTPGVRALDVTVAGEPVLRDGRTTRVDAAEVRAKAAEQAARLFARL